MSESLEGRLERLERANRRLARLLLVFAAVAVAPWLAAATGKSPGAKLEVSELVLRDAGGARRGGLVVDAAGAARLVLADAAGRDRVSVATTAEGRASLAFTDERGNPRARFQTAGDSSLNFYDRNGKLRAALGVTEYGPRWVSEAVDRAILKSATSGNPFSMGEGDLSGTPGDVFQAQDGPVLRFFDPRGRPRLEARVDMNRPVIFLHTDQGTLQAVKPQAAPLMD